MDPRDQVARPFDVIRRLRLRSDATVADIGAGTAYFTIHLADAVPRGQVIATDIRAVALGIVRRRAAAAGCSNVQTLSARIDHSCLDPCSVDLAFLCQVDHHLANRVSYFRSVVEALRSDGRMAIMNAGRFFRANMLAGRELGMEVADEWWPSSGYFLQVLKSK